MSTKTLLVEDLSKKPKSPERDRIVENAIRGYYHDFETTIALPKMQLVKDLEKAGFPDLAQNVKNGKYDE